MNKVFLIDIGNSSIDVGVGSKRGVRFLFKLSASEDSFPWLRQKLGNRGENSYLIFSSVVPSLSKSLRFFLKKNFLILECGKEVQIPIRNLYYKKKEVGQDRLLNCFAARQLYEKTRVVVDLGTALTFDFISEAGEYLGGLIVPGASLSRKALLQRAALLPQEVRFRPPKNLIAKTTAGCINAGIYFGYSLMIKGVLDYYRRKLKNDFVSLGCGGDIRYISLKLSSLDYLEPYLSLKGLYLLAKYRNII